MSELLAGPRILLEISNKCQTNPDIGWLQVRRFLTRCPNGRTDPVPGCPRTVTESNAINKILFGQPTDRFPVRNGMSVLREREPVLGSLQWASNRKGTSLREDIPKSQVARTPLSTTSQVIQQSCLVDLAVRTRDSHECGVVSRVRFFKPGCGWGSKISTPNELPWYIGRTQTCGFLVV